MNVYDYVQRPVYYSLREIFDFQTVHQRDKIVMMILSLQHPCSVDGTQISWISDCNTYLSYYTNIAQENMYLFYLFVQVLQQKQLLTEYQNQFISQKLSGFRQLVPLEIVKPVQIDPFTFIVQQQENNSPFNSYLNIQKQFNSVLNFDPKPEPFIEFVSFLHQNQIENQISLQKRFQKIIDSYPTFPVLAGCVNELLVTFHFILQNQIPELDIFLQKYKKENGGMFLVKLVLYCYQNESGAREVFSQYNGWIKQYIQAAIGIWEQE
ncbi:Hypothetical_protein [Hexamita inflata]|uniref:Hypothetical_protein n=1 Tax=Hexamita inflata TaxID=28002 RepID=A0AA86NQY4_9EUKA|nr:Hypothetical protein HINF_LOCUS10856 [Hexamita inflata]